MESFYVINQRVDWEQTIEKSRFIGVVMPVSNVSDIEAAFQLIKNHYPNARHYVYAYRLHEGFQEKSSDDGEPQGTGGRPVLEILQYRKIWNVLLVVVRYFGGILLGTGGLARAYGGTARQLLEEANTTLLIPNVTFRLRIPYPWYEPLRYQFNQHSWKYGKEKYSDVVECELYIPEEEADFFERWIDNFTSGQLQWKKEEIDWKN